MKKHLLLASSALFAMAVLMVGCKSKTDSKANLMDSEAVKSVAQWMGFDVGDGERIKGVRKFTLTGSQDFAQTEWEWSSAGGSQMYEVSADKRQISWYETPSNTPTPGSITNNSVIHFADFSLPDQAAKYSAVVDYTTAWTYEDLDKTGAVVTTTGAVGSSIVNTTQSAAITYDSATGYPSKYLDQKFVASGTHNGKVLEVVKEVNYSVSPFDDKFYSSSENQYTVFDGTTAATLLGTVEVARTRNISGAVTTDTTSYTCKNAAGSVTANWDTDAFIECSSVDLASLIYSSGYSGTGTLVKAVVSDVTDTSATSSQQVKTTSYYTGDTSASEVYRTVETTSYTGAVGLGQQSKLVEASYSVSGGVATLTYQRVREYTKFNRNSSDASYSVSGGVATLFSTDTTSYDANYNPTSTVTTNASGATTASVSRTYDTQNRKTNQSTYSVSGTVSTAVSKVEYSYSEDSTGARTYTETNYGVDPADTTKFKTDPSTKTVYSYDKTLRLRTAQQTYSFAANTWTLTSQTEYQYTTGGALYKTLTYSVSAGTPTLARTTTQLRDSRDFRNGFQYSDKNGNLCSSNSFTAGNACQTACTAGAICYSSTTYTYK